MKKLLVLGASGDGKVVADIALQNEYSEIAFLDDNDKIKECLGFPVIGTISTYKEFINEYDFFIAIGNPATRKRIYENLVADGCSVVTLIHPSAIVARSVSIGFGTVVMAGAVINPSVKIGNGCIINTCASVDHDCILEDFVHISVGAHLAGTVVVKESTWIGIGAVVSNNLEIASGCMIGAGAVAVENINEKGTYVGVPARKIQK